ncbi:hypothetical protein LTR05_006957 [Lithohypha guttulata]|uniref:Uncharacterized protein n=1 Tax=Lithohypha guttulata TaxID=1690604 RepID=A0AAN7SWT6_9EURO|nr:hypothetical protein LTR05_006957 [Lithohypha guttulata]
MHFSSTTILAVLSLLLPPTALAGPNDWIGDVPPKGVVIFEKPYWGKEGSAGSNVRVGKNYTIVPEDNKCHPITPGFELGSMFISDRLNCKRYFWADCQVNTECDSPWIYTSNHNEDRNQKQNGVHGYAAFRCVSDDFDWTKGARRDGEDGWVQGPKDGRKCK